MTKEPKLQVISETNLGLYVWICERNGRQARVQDEDGNIMNIQAYRGDLTAINKLAEAARYYGVEDGRAVFIEGARQIDDEELQEQTARLDEGLIPDPQDIGNFKDEMRKWKK